MSLLWRSRRRRPLPHKNRGLSTKKTGVKESPPHLTHGTHRTHAWHTEHSSTGIAVEKYLQKKELELSTTLGCPPNSHCSSSSSSSSSVTLVAACIYRRAAETPSSTDLQGPKKKATATYKIGSHSYTARTNYSTRVMLLPDLLAGGRRVWHYSQLVVARALHCSCSAFLLSVVSGLLTCMIQEEQVGQRKGRAFKPKIGHRDHFTVLTSLEVSPYFLVPGIIFRGVHDT